jgi:hypothetical protein
LQNIIWTFRHQGPINHITGDIHYIALGLTKPTAILTIHDLYCIWIVYPYCEIPKAGWRDDRHFLIAKFLSRAGYQVQLFIPSFSHKEKAFVTTQKQHQLQPNLNIVYVETQGYASHISLKRIKHEKAFAKFIAANTLNLPLPSAVILREPAIFTYSGLKTFIESSGAKLILDIIDL